MCPHTAVGETGGGQGRCSHLAQGHRDLRYTKGQAARSTPICHTDVPDLAGLFLNGFHGTFHGAEQRLDLIGCLLQQEAGHKLVHIAPTFVHLGASGESLDVGWHRDWGHLGLATLLCGGLHCLPHLRGCRAYRAGPLGFAGITSPGPAVWDQRSIRRGAQGPSHDRV